MKVVYPDAVSNIRELLHEDLIAELKQVADFQIYDGRPTSTEELIKRIGDADALLLGEGVTNEVLEACSNLKAIAFIGYGVKNYVDVPFANKQNIKVMNTPGYGDNAVAEHALALMLSLAKNIPRNDLLMKQGYWVQETQNIELAGKTIGLIGMGGIAVKMSALCKALGMNVISWTFNPSEERAKQLGIRFVELDYLLSHSDFVSLHLPYTEKTKGILGEKEFSFMKEGAYFINTARSELVDTQSLMKYLMNGKIEGAGLDVFDKEPVAPDNPFLSLENVILSPHVGYNTSNAILNMLEISVHNLIDFFRGKPKNLL